MAANVTIRAKFHGDWRPKYLAQLLGIGEGDVRWALVELWSWQTESFTPEAPTYEVSRKELVGRFGPKGPEALVEAELALAVAGERYYIRGTRGDDDGKGDIAWLSNKRVAGGKGGAKRADRAAAGEVRAPARASGGRFGRQADAEAPPDQDGSGAEAEPKQNGSTSEAAPNPRDQGSGSGSQTSLSGSAPAREAIAVGTVPAIAPVATAPTSRGVDAFQALADELHERHSQAAAQLAREVPAARGASFGGGMLVGDRRAAVIQVIGRLAEQAQERGVDVREHVLASLEHVIAVRLADAKRTNDTRWWAAGRFWGWNGFEIDLAQTVEQVEQRGSRPPGGRGGGGHGGAAPRASPGARTGQAQPASNHGIGPIKD